VKPEPIEQISSIEHQPLFQTIGRRLRNQILELDDIENEAIQVQRNLIPLGEEVRNLRSCHRFAQAREGLPQACPRLKVGDTAPE
jgi:hypothetical protein